jgi:hypothetical protein
MALLLLPQAAAQAPVDLSGVWQMDASRSESAHQDVPIGPVTLTIKQSPAAISIATRRAPKDKSPASTESLTFKLDGSEDSIVSSSGATVKVKAHWDGAKLVAETARNIQGSTVTTLQVFSLDPSGKEMTVDKTLTVQHGYQFPGAHNTGSGKDVFVKRKNSDKK